MPTNRKARAAKASASRASHPPEDIHGPRSPHAAGGRLPPRAPRPPLSVQSKELICVAAFLAGLAAWLLSLALGALPAWRALLASFLYFTPLAGAMVVWPAVVQASNGGWAGSYASLPATGLGFAPASLAILLALWMAAGSWAPWPGRTFAQGWWLQSDFLFARDFAALALFWGLAWWYSRRRGHFPATAAGRTPPQAAGWAAPRITDVAVGVALMVAYGCVFSLLGFDLIMALTPHWHSSLLGGYLCVSGLYAGVAAWAVLAARQPEPDPDRLHDLGKLTLAFSLLTTYFMYSQLLPIWYENLPSETGFVALRLNFHPWICVGAALLAAVYLGPLVMLLTVRAKRRPRPLGAVCLLILLGLWVERWWLVAPSLPGGPIFGLADLGAGLALLGIFGFGVLRLGRLLPPIRPARTERP